MRHDNRVIQNYDNPWPALRKDLEDLSACYVDMVGDETMRKDAEKSLPVIADMLMRIGPIEIAETLGNAIAGGSK